MTYHGIDFDPARIGDFCRRHSIVRLSLFGSILGEDFGPDSTINVLVEFYPHLPTHFVLGQIQVELTNELGRFVDLKTWGDILDSFRSRIQHERTVVYQHSEQAPKLPAVPTPVSAAESDELLQQYDMLRKEILGNDPLVMQVNAFTFAFVGVAIVTSFSSRDTIPLIAVPVVLFWINQYLTRMRDNTWRIASYLRTVVEPSLKHVKWETRLCEFRRLRPKHKGFWHALTVMHNVEGLFPLVLGIIIAMTAWWMNYANWNMSGQLRRMALMLLALIPLSTASFRNRKRLESGRCNVPTDKMEQRGERSYDQIWLEVLKREATVSSRETYESSASVGVGERKFPWRVDRP